MKIKRLLLYLDILTFILSKKSCSVFEILENFEIKEKTLYENLESWSKEGYMKNEEHVNSNRIKVLKIHSTEKLKKIESYLKKISINSKKMIQC